MRKILISFFVLITMAIYVKADAFTLNDALFKIQSLRDEVVQLKESLKANALTTTDPNACKIVSFTVTPTIIMIGQSVTIKWETLNCKSISISASDAILGFGMVGNSGSKIIFPNKDISYYLTATESTSTGLKSTSTTPILVKVAKNENVSSITSVTISGIPEVGQTLKAVVSPSGSNATYSWMRKDSSGYTSYISGATSSSYLLTEKDVGSTIFVIAKGANGYVGGENGDIRDSIVIPVKESINPAYMVAPTLTNPKSQNITKNSAVLSATITDLGYPTTITERGICYSVGTNPRFQGALADCIPSTNNQTIVLVSNLKPGTSYYFKGYAKNSAGIGYSEDGTFKTLSDSSVPPSITVLSPNGGEEFSIGNKIKIKWTSKNIISKKYDVLLLDYHYNKSCKIGVANVLDNYFETVLNSDSCLQQANLIKPELLAGKYKVFINDPTTGEEILSDVSDDYFMIKDLKPKTDIDTVTVKELLNNSSLKSKYIGKEIILSGFVMSGNYWRNGTDKSKSISLYSEIYTSDLNVSKWIEVDIESTGIMNSILNEYNKYNPLPSFMEVKIRGTLNKDSLAYYGLSLDAKELLEISNSTKNITPSITVLSPNGGESYTTGQQITVKWNSNNLPNDSKINISLAGYNLDGVMRMFTPMSVTTANDGVEIVNLPKIPSYVPGLSLGKYFKVEITDGNGHYDQSDNYFAIISSKSCPTNVPPVSCGLFETEAVKDVNGCIVRFQCVSSLNNTSVVDNKTNSVDVSDISKINRTLKQGTRGEDVKVLQNLLGVNADGVFGRMTASMVKAWQIEHKLKADGLFGKSSRAAAIAELE